MKGTHIFLYIKSSAEQVQVATTIPSSVATCYPPGRGKKDEVDSDPRRKPESYGKWDA